ncbi:cupredoxin family protein [Actimicrobium antarcticum]|uniref:Cupredoxin family protein n=1 Tax=Actimicrobium antarcticum TaxID=1051899 RepID=A0ABP7SSI4_9BURK
MKNTISRRLCQSAVLILALGVASTVAFAHGDGKPKVAAPISAEEHAFGKQGEPAKASRTVTIDMNDMMRFGPSAITVRQGETIRFVVRNKGKMLHEMVIGTLDELKVHGELMKKFPGMEHDAPYMAHVKPGKKEDIVWQFDQPGEFHYACLMPGHFEAGMVGKIIVTKG